MLRDIQGLFARCNISLKGIYMYKIILPLNRCYLLSIWFGDKINPIKVYPIAIYSTCCIRGKASKIIQEDRQLRSAAYTLAKMMEAKKIFIAVGTALVLIAIALGVGLSGLNYDPGPGWEFIPDEAIAEGMSRFDCFPEGQGASKETCEARGCIWYSTEVEGAPWCYFPKEKGVPGYRMVRANND